MTTVVAVAALLFTGLAQRSTNHQLKINAEGQITDQLSKAIEHLGSSTLDVRLGGVYALERVMRDSAPDQPAITEILTAFVREHTLSPAANRTAPRADVQSVLTVLGRRDTSHDGTRALDLTGAHLSGAILAGAHLTGTDLAGAHLAGASLARANLAGANLAGADLTGAVLAGADLAGANLAGADLTHADLIGTDLAGGVLAGANLTHASLAEADLTRASVAHARLPGANLAGANLTHADLGGANLGGANLTDTDLREADLGGAYVAGANLAGANLTGANLVGADLTHADLRGALGMTGRQLSCPFSCPLPGVDTQLPVVIDRPASRDPSRG